MALDVNTAGCEFVKTVLSLYRTNKYFREKEVLAKKLLDHSIEAGRLITELGDCSETKESAVAVAATDELSKALFVVKIMNVEGIYSLRRVQPVITLGEQIKELLKLYIDDTPPQPEKIVIVSQPAQPVQDSQPEPQVQAQPVAQLQEDNSEQLSLLGNDKENDGGFNDIYYGTI